MGQAKRSVTDLGDVAMFLVNGWANGCLSVRLIQTFIICGHLFHQTVPNYDLIQSFKNKTVRIGRFNNYYFKTKCTAYCGFLSAPNDARTTLFDATCTARYRLS